MRTQRTPSFLSLFLLCSLLTSCAHYTHCAVRAAPSWACHDPRDLPEIRGAHSRSFGSDEALASYTEMFRDGRCAEVPLHYPVRVQDKHIYGEHLTWGEIAERRMNRSGTFTFQNSHDVIPAEPKGFKTEPPYFMK